ncbi:MAG: helix-turn-helix transcriptional regulator [Clostridia bacterium]|nr:helix-turn-helix transcriptional regulator [Clostridia bacterium]
MKEINIAKNIVELRKKKGITQEQLASTLNITPQAVSKWETGASLPDTQTLPLIADHFGVSIDYLFYGQDISYDEIYEKLFRKVAAHPQMSKESYEDALTLFGYAHHGISRGNLKGKIPIRDVPAHLAGPNGVSLLSGRGYGAILTRSFFEHINRDTAEFATTLLPALSDRVCFLVCMAILSMSDISYGELQEKLGISEEELRLTLDRLIAQKIVIEKVSKHKSLGRTYDINDMYHTCLCILIATVEMQRYSLTGISCCMGYGDYPISF